LDERSRGTSTVSIAVAVKDARDTPKIARLSLDLPPSLVDNALKKHGLASDQALRQFCRLGQRM
jgi:hypothetical protein